MRLPAEWTPHTIKARPYSGEGGNGPVLGEQVTVAGVYVEDVREVVLDASGAEVVSSSKVHMSLEDAFAEQSLVTVWPGTPFEREAQVVKVSRHQHPRWPGYVVAYLK